MYGDGLQSRAFSYVGDVVHALVKLVKEPHAIGEVINLGSSEEISIMELARRVKTLTQSKSEIVLVPYDQAYESGFEDMPRRLPDLTKINRLIGYQPTIDLDEILRRVIADNLAEDPV